MICFDELALLSGLDLSFERQTSGPLRGYPAWGGDASRQARFRAGHGASAAVDIPPLPGTLRRPAQAQELLVSGPVLRDGLRAVDVSRVVARRRGVSGHAGTTAVPRFSFARGAQHAGQRQRSAALADLRRPGAASDRHHSAGLCERAHRSGLEADGLRLRRHHERLVLVGLSVGAVWLDQGRRQSCTRCWTCAARSPASFTSATARPTRSTCSMCSRPSQAPSTWSTARGGQGRGRQAHHIPDQQHNSGARGRGRE